MTSNEAFDRNQTLQTIHNTKLPSYSLWDNDSIEDTLFSMNGNWWKAIHQIYLKKKIADKPTTQTILKWIKFYDGTEEPLDEYCSKRNGHYLDCDI